MMNICRCSAQRCCGEVSIGSTVTSSLCTAAGTGAVQRRCSGHFSVAVTWEDGAEIEEDVLNDLKAATRSLTRGIRWRDGDFALIDNNRQLHGRNQSRDPDRDIVMLSSFSTRFRL
jgi:hypothetical protein